MALLGQKCDRCGTRTRHKEYDKPICEACAEEMRLIVAASKETKRLCPIDGAQMSKEIAHMLVIDRCPSCRGVWLDGGELERLKEGVEISALKAISAGFTHPLG